MSTRSFLMTNDKALILGFAREHCSEYVRIGVAEDLAKGAIDLAVVCTLGGLNHKLAIGEVTREQVREIYAQLCVDDDLLTSWGLVDLMSVPR